MLLVPACDPSQLSDAQREILTGTTDAGTTSVEVTPAEAVLGDVTEFTYTVRWVNFTGTLFLALRGLPSDIEVVQDVRDAETPTGVSGTGETGTLTGTFRLRARRQAAEPVDAFLELVSVGTAGSRLEQRAAIRLLLRPLGLACTRDPGKGTAPLTVHFEARPSGCLGPCTFRWELGDRTVREERNVDHVYAEVGEYEVVGVLEDGPERVAVCRKDVVVVAALSEPKPTPVPSPPPTGPEPTASFTVAVTCCPTTLRLDGSASTGAITSYAWDLSWTPEAPDAVTTSPTVTFPITATEAGSIRLTVTDTAGRTSSASVLFVN
jgi:hypothetical protein